MAQSFHSVEELVADIKQGKMVILVDDEDRENEGDLVIAAEHITPDLVNFMVREARGLVCLSLTKAQCGQLHLPLMVRDDHNYSPNKTAFMVSIEAAEGVSTGISAADRARTILAASNPEAKPTDIIMPGHIFPIMAQNGGVLKRAGHTEGSVDLCQLAGLFPAAVICEVMNDDGTMARVSDLFEFAEKHDMKIGTIVDMINYRLENETLVEEITGEGPLGELSKGFETRIFRSRIDGSEHIVLTKGNVNTEEPVLVRVHSEDRTTDLLGSLRAHSQSPMSQAVAKISEQEAGVFLYLRNPSTSSDFSLIQTDHAPAPMDAKDYGIGAQILRQLGIQKIRLLSDNPKRRIALKGYGLEIVDTVPFTSDSAN